MKNTFIYLILIAFTFNACKKDESTTSVDSISYFKMKINGVDYVDNGYAEGLFVANTSTNVVSYSLDGKTTLTLYFDANNTGTYVNGVNNTGASIERHGPNSTDTSYYSNSGSIIITKYDIANKKISGNFNLVLKNGIYNRTLNLTDGEFNNLPLTEF